MVKYLVEKGVSVNEINKNGETPLFLLIRNEYISDEFETTVRFLLDSGADPNIQLKHNNPLVAALQINSVNVAALLLEYGAKVNEIEDGPTALHVLFKNYHGSIKDIKDYVQYTSDNGNVNMVNAQDSDGETALNPELNSPHTVNQKIKMENIIQKILDCGADINALDDYGHSPLSIVCNGKSGDPAGRARIGIHLMSKGADPDKDCALHQAILNINYNKPNAEWSEFILKMMDIGANPITYKDKKPILLSAIESGCPEVVKGLLDKGVDIHATDNNGNTCLHLACDLKKDTERKMIATLLLNHGCSVNKLNTYGTFPLSNLIKRITKERNSKKIVQMETRTYAEIDLSLFNLLICGGSFFGTKMKTLLCSSEESILANLTKHGYLKAAGALIKCGYDFQNDENFRKCNLEQPESSFIFKKRWYNRVCYENDKREFLKLLEIFQDVDFSLSSLCKDVIRNHLINVGQGSEIESKIMRLPLPDRIKTFLSLREHMEEVETIQIEKEESMSAYFNTPEDSEDDVYYDEYYDSDYLDMYMYDDDSDSYGDDFDYDLYAGYRYESGLDSF
ncbi:putative ankyrin repeat protein RF_0381 [Saccostrea cucullata]|uniref:putative ankyrin repeat protein RF_0381 n=1 Tax=Saccostrea cuccullata TaxID=36930 RepID=UPI002ED1AA44